MSYKMKFLNEKEVNETKKSRYILCIELLTTFSKKELAHLNDLVNCRYFNTDKHVIKLLDVLTKSVLNKRIFTEEVECNVYQKVFDDLPAPKHVLDKKQKGTLNVKLNILIRLAEQFLACEVLKNDEASKSELLYTQLLERKQLTLFNRHINKNKKRLNNLPTKSIQQYEQIYKIETNIFTALYRDGQLLVKDNLSEVNRSLDIYYLLNKLNLHASAVSLLRVSGKKEYDFSSMEAVNKLLDISEYAEHPLVVLSQTNIELLKNQDSEVYDRLLMLLDRYAEAVPTHLLRNYYSAAISYCAAMAWADRLGYAEKMFDLFTIMHNKNLLIEDNFIYVGKLKNMTTVGCQLSKFEWVEHIIEYYRPFIREEVRDSVCHFLYGTVAFYQKDYETAHDRFIQVDKINSTYDVNTRVIILKCLYEKEKEYNEYTMTAFRSIESFFKLNKQLSQKNKKGYINFIKMLMALYRIRYHEGSRTLEWVEQQLEQQTLNSNKPWLLEKIKELRGHN